MGSLLGLAFGRCSFGGFCGRRWFGEVEVFAGLCGQCKLGGGFFPEGGLERFVDGAVFGGDEFHTQVHESPWADEAVLDLLVVEHRLEDALVITLAKLEVGGDVALEFGGAFAAVFVGEHKTTIDAAHSGVLNDKVQRFFVGVHGQGCVSGETKPHRCLRFFGVPCRAEHQGT